jgi:hypothetical protein
MMNPIEGFRDPPHSALRFNSIGSLAMLAAMRRASSIVKSLAVARERLASHLVCIPAPARQIAGH